ncbi:MAG TPA: hypothetical protein VN513_02030 [Gemmatimonadales bacterium]|nr:hypothetical protein [Gemmatimonadales bacterium]
MWLLAAAACTKGVEPSITACTAADDSVALTVDAYGFFDPAVAQGCTVFPATAGAAQYLVVPQLTAGNPGDKAEYRLGGDTISPVTPSPSVQQLRTLGAAERFHLFLRLGDERRSWGFAPELGPPRAPPQPTPQVGPPVYNQLRTFQVCAKLDCSRFDRVGARVKGISSKVAIYVDTLAPGGGLDSVALDSVARTFDTRLYAIDTAAFGRESDINQDSVVLVLMTNTVNKLVSAAECNSGGFVAGFFFGVDIDPALSNDSRSNKAEIFYSIVADPAGTLSCAHSVGELQAFVPVTFIHEFQHMISFNQHVLVRHADGELLWLNEGFSHYAEELGGRSYESNGDARVADCTIGTVACRFYAGNLLNANDYLDSTGNHYLLPTEGIGTLAERGAAWLFVRYVVDQYAAGTTRTTWNAFTRTMVETSQVGFANVEAATGDQFEDVVSRWGLANYVTDIASAPAELKFVSWDMHAVFASLHTQRPALFPNVYPVNPTVSAGRDVNMSGTLHSGSPIYVIANQPAGDPGFTLSLTAPNGALISSAMKPRLNVYRLQ